jgi:hypothetical protein
MIKNTEFNDWLEKEKSIHLMPVNMYKDTKYAEDIKIERTEEHYCYIGHYYRCATASIIRKDELIGLMTTYLLSNNSGITIMQETDGCYLCDNGVDIYSKNASLYDCLETAINNLEVK